MADWIETTLLLRGTRQLGTDALLVLGKEELQLEPPQVNLALRVMKRRSELLQASYPFLMHEVAVRAKPDAVKFPYSALLLLTSGSVARQLLFRVPTDQMVVMFERLTEAALANLWGGASRALRFGYPSDHGRPVEFPAAIEWLADQLGIAVGSGYRPPRRRDGGVDVIGWRPFADGRTGFPLLLVQCTLQADLISKATDVDARLWSSWLKLDFEPLTALAVPQTIPQGVLWDQLALRCMVLDRMRLAGLLTADVAVSGVTSWVDETVEALGSEMVGGAI